MFQRAYSIRLYPTPAQQGQLTRTFGCARLVYNCMLEARQKSYAETGRQCKSKPTDFYAKYPFLKEVDSQALTSERLNLNAAYKNFYERKNLGVGLPQFKSKHRDPDSYTSYTTKNNIRIEGDRLRLPKVGMVKFRDYTDIDWSVRTIKHITVKRSRSGKYYASLMVEEPEPPKALPPNDKAVGIDLGLVDLIVTSDGEVVSAPRYLLAAQQRLAQMQRAFAKMKVDSKRREAMRRRIAKLHEKIAHQRKDFLDKLSTRIVRENQTICIESLDVKEVAEGEHAKSEHDCAWGAFIHMLEYKCDWYGRTLVKVDRWFPSSQLCHCCGYRFRGTKDETVRSWICPHCGADHDRDFNAALNILAEGLRIIAAGTAVKRASNSEADTL